MLLGRVGAPARGAGAIYLPYRPNTRDPSRAIMPLSSQLRPSPPSSLRRAMEDVETSSVFSEQNPLPSDADHVYSPQRDAKVPKAVVLTGWSRTVGMDEDYVAPIANVRLGAPGTGLASTALPPHGGTLGPTLGRKAREQALSSSQNVVGEAYWSSSSAFVTADDLAAAAALRKVRPPPDAVPLPSPRPWSETDASSVAESPESTAKRRQERGFRSSSSSASSGLSFIVGPPGSGSFFGTRPTKGREVGGLVPANVGEGCLHNSLAKYFGHELSEPEGDRGESLEIMSVLGESATTNLGQSADEQSSAQDSTPATKVETRESSFEEAPRIPVTASSRPEAYMCYDKTNNRDMVKASGEDATEPLERSSSSTGRLVAPPADVSSRVIESRAGWRRQHGGDAEDGKGGKTASGSSDYVEGDGRRSFCGCLRRGAWPWKVGAWDTYSSSLFFVCRLFAVLSTVSTSNPTRCVL